MQCLLVRSEITHIKGMNVMGRRYRRRNHSGQIITDSVFICSRWPWYGAFLFGLITYLIFYYAIPYLFFPTHVAQAGSYVSVGAEVLNARYVRLFQYIGTATGAIGLFYAVRNYLVPPTAKRSENRIVALLARLIGRHLD